MDDLPELLTDWEAWEPSDDNDAEPIDTWATHPSLTPADRNPSLCRR
jgi:hypothetical protein